MKVLIQKVRHAHVEVEHKIVGSIERGLLLLVGIAPDDTAKDIEFVVRKVLNMRLFEDEAGVMNHSVLEVSAQILCVSQFTLLASTRKGNRPSYSQAARPEIALPLFETMVVSLEKGLGKTVPTGVFGADMQVHLVNDGPVTIMLDSRECS